MGGGDAEGVRTTGGQVDEMVMALIDSAYDKDGRVKQVITDSLFELGKKQPALVLSSCHYYLVKHSKLTTGHRVVILTCIERILKETLDQLEKDLAETVIKQASFELTSSKEVQPEWQTAASNVLVAVGMKYCNEVMAELHEKFQPGVLPHFFVVQTMANLSVANVYGMVPFLKGVLGQMLPMLGMAKQDNMRWVFSAALAKFSESILDYVANIEKAPDPAVRKEAFSGEIDSAYDVVFNVWLHSRESKLRVAIVEALGQMVHIMTWQKLQEQLPKLLQAITGLYKRHSEPFHVTQGLGMILDAATADGSTILEPYLDNLLNVLFPQACQAVDYSNPSTVKNHNEVLRCFSALSKSFTDKMIAFLLIKLEVNNDKTRIGTLSIFRHLVNGAGPHMEEKKDVILSGLKVVLQDTNNKVKKALAQLIIAMAHHGYLELEGGQLMIEFIVRQCSLLPELQSGKRSPDPEHVSNDALRMMCDNVLHLLSTTVENMETVLWPYLLECLVPEQYTEAVGSVCRGLAHIAAKKREEESEDYKIDFEKEVNIPKPTALTARLIVLAGRPLNGRNRGTNVLQTMKALSPNIHENLAEIWDAVIPKLVQFLHDAGEDEDKWSQKSWEDLALKMLSKSLDAVDNEDWISELGEALGQQIPLYNFYPEEKNFLYKCLGVIMRKSAKKDFVAKHLDLVFSTVKHTSQLEREGCAIAAGFTAASHLDSVIAKLDSVMKNDANRKSGGFLGFIKDQVNRSDVDEKTKATLMLCYGYVALYAPTSLIASRLETTILKAINPHFNHIKDPGVKQNLIRAVELIGKAMHPEHLGSSHKFSQRSDLINHMLSFMKSEPTGHIHNETRALSMNCCSTLVKLDPILPESEVFELVRISLDCYVPLPPGGVKKGKDETYEDHLESEAAMKATEEAIQDLLSQIILKDPTPHGLESVFKHLYPWTLVDEEHERERAMDLSQNILQLYLEKVDLGLGMCSNCHSFGVILAQIIPRCSDPDAFVRQRGIDSVQTLLKIQQRYQGLAADHKDQMVDALPLLKDRLKKTDPNILFSVVNDLSKVVGKCLPSDQLLPFLNQLYEALLDPQSHSSSGACVVLNSVVKSRGGELHTEVDKLVDQLHEKLGQITCAQTRTGSLRCVRTLASHHLLSVLNTLLGYPLPLDQNVIDCWQIIAQDAHLMAAIIDHVLELLSRGLPYEERPATRDRDPPVRTATPMPLAATFALSEMFKVEEAEQPIMNNYHRLIAAVMIRVASSVNVKAPPMKNKDERKSKEKKSSTSKDVDLKPSSVSVDALKNLLKISKSEDLLNAMESEDVWWKFEDETEYPEAFTEFASLLCQHQPQYVGKIITAVNPILSSVYEPQRVMAAAFFAELINQKCAGDMALVEMLVNSLLGRLVDNSHVVRKLCIRGLGNVASNGPEQVQKYTTTVLSAMMAGMDDKDDLDDDITLEAMSGLSRVLAEIDESHIRAILINISLRIRPCFEKDKAGVRAAAFTLFGNLSRFGDGPSKSPFLEQIHTNLVSLLLHLNDPEPEVRKACKYALRLLGPLIGSENINNMFQKFLLDDATLHYGEFMNDLSKTMIQDFPDKLNFYVMGNVSFFKSMWPEIKGNAAMFVGFLLGNMPKEKYAGVSKEHVCGALILLLKDSSPDVRVKAAEATSQLFDF